MLLVPPPSPSTIVLGTRTTTRNKIRYRTHQCAIRETKDQSYLPANKNERDTDTDSPLTPPLLRLLTHDSRGDDYKQTNFRYHPPPFPIPPRPPHLLHPQPRPVEAEGHPRRPPRPPAPRSSRRERAGSSSSSPRPRQRSSRNRRPPPLPPRDSWAQRCSRPQTTCSQLQLVDRSSSCWGSDP